MSKSTPKKRKTDNSNIIRFRADKALSKKLRTIAPLRRKRFGEFMRDELWKLVDREEAALGIAAKGK